MQNKAPLRIVKASAGSGKTFSLTIHYLSLLLAKEHNYREILAVTFTNKATAEMKERILMVLHGLAIADPSKKIQAYREILLKENPQWDPQGLQTQAHQIYRRILHDYSHFSVSTIDGFSQKVIRSFTYELNLDSGYAIEMNSNKVKRDLTVMLNQLLDDRPDLLDWIINYAEKKIANNENWNYRQQLMSLAGLIFSENFQEFDAYILSAESDQVFELLDREVSEKTTAFLDALSAAIDNFQLAYQKLGIQEADLSGKSRNKLISAFKINANIKKASVSELDEVFSKYAVLTENAETIFLDQTKTFRPEWYQGVQGALGIIADLQTHFPTYIAYQAVQTNLYFLRLLKEMSDLLSQWRKENGAQLISDAQILLNKIGLDDQNDPTFIWEKIGNRYNYFLFDEFQDTSRIQWKNYSPLLLNALANAQGNSHEHLIVGDVKQSIYRWRNGDWRILLQQVEQQISQNFHLNANSIHDFIDNGTLLTNFRSLPNIIKLNNYLFEQVPKILQDILNRKVSESLDEVGVAWWKTSGNQEMLIKAYQDSQQTIPEALLSNDKPQGSIEIQYFPVKDGRFRRNQVMEVSTQALCEKIGEWISTGRYQAKQIGILVRSNAQAKFLIQELMRYKNANQLNFEVISGDALTLFSNHGIQLLIETFRGLIYQSDKHVLYLAKMAYLYQLTQGKSAFNPEAWLQFKNNRMDLLSDVLPQALISEWSALQKLPIVHLTEKLIEIYDLGSKGSIHLPYLLAFKDIITQFSSMGERGLIQFLEYWDEDGEKAILPSNGKIDAIEVSTIHKSKGLAYDVVMIPFCSWSLDGLMNGDFWINVQDSPFATLGKIPVKYNAALGKSIFYQQYFEEMLFNYMDALNTFYVATTRAKQHLYLTAPQFKAIDEKDGQQIPGFEVKDEYISDLLFQTLYEPTAIFPIQDCQINIQDTIWSTEEDDEDQKGLKIALASYPMSKELETALDRSTKRNINHILMMEEAARYGVLAHEIISKIKHESEIDPLVDQYIEEGVLEVSARSELMQEIQEIWHHPQINRWLTTDYKIWNEASIITEDGKTLRPDKVFSKDQETIVLDFKFTKGDYIEHKYQVGKYMDALQHVGYTQVTGYLYYAKTKELVAVN